MELELVVGCSPGTLGEGALVEVGSEKCHFFGVSMAVSLTVALRLEGCVHEGFLMELVVSCVGFDIFWQRPRGGL